MMRSKKKEREHNMKEAWASCSLEGYEPSEYGKMIGQMYIDGKITAQEQVALIREHYGLEAEAEKGKEKRRKKRKEWEEMENERKAHEWQVRLNRQRQEQDTAQEPGALDTTPGHVPGWRELMEEGRAKQADTGHDERQRQKEEGREL